MSRHALLAVVLSVFALVGGVGVVAGQTATSSPTATPNGTATSTPAGASDVPAEYLANPAEGVYIVDYRFQSGGEVVVEWYISQNADLPVTVKYADVGASVQGEPGVRQPAVLTDAIVRSGEVESTYPATDGPAGQITQISVEGQPIVIEGEGTGQRGIVQYLSANESLLVGAALALAGTLVAGYRRKQEDELDEPENAFRGGDSR